ncbi:unnamed protein product [Adineta steineri]|uniref:Uncharacterized protein n=1 Tax=Adineta steineri TaxID=433720 RepID=A0A819VV38_9BILA|nr:unnamed protein product [Adineta steineri]CAF1312172.1 unnamed protein product [Adineta steineri]CAF3686187.1 unnamed protein product [Adineta steineri]CAF4114772.1 unnamed protein product [Adineta steineri]
MNISSTASQQRSDVGGKESSSISSFDEYLLDNTSSSYTKEESDLLIENNNDIYEELFHELLNNISLKSQIQHEIDEFKLYENITTRTNNEGKQ